MKKRWSYECPEWGPRDTHNYQDEDDGHELAACLCGAPNPRMGRAESAPYVDDGTDPPF
jgi:hypothetical protein